MPMYQYGNTVSDGAPGIGVPAGGAKGQVLGKASDNDFDTTWVNMAAGPATQERLIAAPKGAIMGWTDPDNIPDGWHICDGEGGTLDLRGKFLLGANEDHAVGDEGGEETHTLTVEEMPRHSHQFPYHSSFTSGQTGSNAVYRIFSNSEYDKSTTSAGGGLAHNNMPPFHVIVWIQKMVDDPEPVTMYSVRCPVGCCMVWSGTADNIPKGWAPCDGQDGRPDFRDMFVLGAGEKHPVDDAGGEEEHLLTEQEMPRHTHTYTGFSGSSSGRTGSEQYYLLSDINYSKLTSNAGRSEPHNNMPPYVSKLYIIKVSPDETDGVTMEQVEAAIDEKLSGILPAETSGGIPAGFIGMWSGSEDEVPFGWALCNGENGTPDLRGRFVLGVSEAHPVGDSGGEEEHTLTVEEMPQHTHSIRGFTGSNGNTAAPLTTNKASGTILAEPLTVSRGNSQSHNNMPPFYALAYIMKLTTDTATT